MAAKPTPLIIDVDTGIDDAFGLLYACASPRARLLGVSTVAGNVDLASATRNTRAVLALAGRADVPVWPGCAAPMLHAPADARAVHGGPGLGYAVLPEPPRRRRRAERDRRDRRRTRSARTGELVLVATGPLTNIALALLREPALPRLLARLVLMGGAYREGGNVTPAAEFNIWHDPEAARIVFRAFARRRRRAARRRRPRRDAHRRSCVPADLDRARATLRRPAARAGAAALPRRRGAPLFRDDGETRPARASSPCTIRSPSPRRSTRR